MPKKNLMGSMNGQVNRTTIPASGFRVGPAAGTAGAGPMGPTRMPAREPNPPPSGVTTRLTPRVVSRRRGR